jgi:2TM domain-containing protein
MTDIIERSSQQVAAERPADRQQAARQDAIKQIERRRRFWVRTVTFTLAMALLVVIWAVNEYHNAGGWPTQGFSESSGIHHVWNSWIIYPLVAWVFGTAAHAWLVFGHKPISEADIQREMERRAGVSDSAAGAR